MFKVASFAERAAQVAAVLLAAIFLASSLIYLCFGYWNITQQDFWRIYYIDLTHTWLQSALLKFNDHSLFFPSFIWLTDLRFFHGNQTLLFGVSLVLLFVSTSVVLVPVWSNQSSGLTPRLLVSLVIVVASFWMGRASIIASGGFGCMTSLVILGVATAVTLLRKLGLRSSGEWQILVLVACAGFLASFSFGTGIAIWPCLLFLGWSTRLSWRLLATVIAGAVAAGVIYYLLPSSESNDVAGEITPPPALASIFTLGQLCRIIGSPLFYAATAWTGGRPSAEMIQSSGWLLWEGIAGVALAATIMLPRLLRRDLSVNSLDFTGVALISFNFCALGMIIAGRAAFLQTLPNEVAAPRYLFWSSLFWAGILIVAISQAMRIRWLCWPVILLTLLIPVGAWARHQEEGFTRRFARLLADEGATGLINGVIDPKRLLFRDAEHMELLLPLLRAQKLDMFAEGLQDWIGRPVSELFGERRDPRRFGGQAAIDRLLKAEDGETACRISGLLLVQQEEIPAPMVIIDSRGIVAGIARASVTDPVVNRLCYGGRMPSHRLVGYISHYDPALQYVIRSASSAAISGDKITVVATSR